MNSWHKRWSELRLLAMALGALAAGGGHAADMEVRGTVNASVDTIVTVLESPCHVRQWMPDLVEVRVIDRPAPGQTRVYMATSAPWPFQPRDAITLFTRQSGDAVTITLRGEPDALPRRQGFVRIPFSEGHWRLLSEGKQTLVTYRLRVDPGGRIPRWLANSASQNRARAAMEALKHYAESPAADRCLPDEPGRDSGHRDLP